MKNRISFPISQHSFVELDSNANATATANISTEQR